MEIFLTLKKGFRARLAGASSSFLMTAMWRQIAIARFEVFCLFAALSGRIAAHGHAWCAALPLARKYPTGASPHELTTPC
ncbi:hypothetical protein [Ottowia beijingensis]|uniref:hypothetical protein n=1 Tax=Ottowia beijingensis TaxID=1207057 RepID=UPI002FDABEB5